MLRFWLFIASVSSVTLALGELIFPLRATATTEGGDGIVEGGITFIQRVDNGPVKLILKFRGLTPGFHGFHIHENPVTNNDCSTAGGHLNTADHLHHGKANILLRHLGDLGNIVADKSGEVNVELVDSLIKLTGPSTIIGRSFVVHANQDDLGMGLNEESKKTGNSGPRIACGTIKIVE